jgi:UDP:flavonoid glycosyltransferase YjiC (YdhE family)
MKIVIATTPAPGHVYPMLGIARILIAEAHEVVAFTGSAFQDRVESIGAAFRQIAASAEQDINGGYGGVNQAMSFGVPLVTAGLTEDKADVNAPVAWSGSRFDSCRCAV